MLLSLIARSLRSHLPYRYLNQVTCRSYATSYDKDCPKTKSCKMEYSQKKTQDSGNCFPKEPNCIKSLGQYETNKELPSGQSQPLCCDSERLARDPCHNRSQCEQKDLQLNRRVLPLKSTWEYPAECCGNPCPEMLPRFDSLYYCPTDKAKRVYQQTWVECPPIQIRQRKVCCYDPNELPPICRRNSKDECPKTACEFDASKMKALSCLSQTKKCPRVKMPCCRTSRAPPLCKNPRGPTDCQKRCCPYPAFSECCRPCPAPRRPVECHCLERRPKCEMYRQLRRKLKYDLPPPLPAWPPKMIGSRS